MAAGGNVHAPAGHCGVRMKVNRGFFSAIYMRDMMK